MKKHRKSGRFFHINSRLLRSFMHIAYGCIFSVLLLCICFGCSKQASGVLSESFSESQPPEELPIIMSVKEVQQSSVTIEFSDKHNDGTCTVTAYDENGLEAAKTSSHVSRDSQFVELKMDVPETPAIYELHAVFIDEHSTRKYIADPVKAAMYSDIASTSRVSGIFVAPELTSEADAEQWNNALKKMSDIGIDTVIVQYSLQNDSRYGRQAYFPYEKEDTVQDSAAFPLRRNQVEYILSAARNADMKVYLGLQIAEYEWFKQDMYRDTEWLHNQSLHSLELADCLWQCFGSEYEDVLAGWYLPFEFESSKQYEPYFEQIANEYYNPLTSALKCNSQYGNLKIMISPLMYQSDDISAWRDTIATVLSDSMIDIIAPQDGIGDGTQSHSSVGKWFAATKEAVDHVNSVCSKTISLWANCENYKRLQNPDETDEIARKKPMSIAKFIDSMDTVAPYVDKLITFSIHRWDTELKASSLTEVNLSYYEAYKRFYETGLKPLNAAEGYCVEIKADNGSEVIFNKYATAGLTDGFAADSDNWSEYKGILTPDSSPFYMEILFDDPTNLSKVTSHYYEDPASSIYFPESVKFEYLVRSGENDDIFTYFPFDTDTVIKESSVAILSAETEAPVTADGVRITVYQSGKWTFIDDIFIE